MSSHWIRPDSFRQPALIRKNKAHPMQARKQDETKQLPLRIFAVDGKNVYE